MAKKIAEGGRKRATSSPKVSVNAYYRSRENDSSISPFEGRKQKKATKKILIRSLDTVFFVVIVLGIIASLVVNPKSDVVVNDTTYHQKKEYADFINSKLGQFKNRNKITFDEASLDKAVMSAFPEVVSSSIELPIFGQKPVVNLDVAKPAFFIKANSDEYLLSSNGVAVDLRSYYPKLGALPTIDDASGFSITKGKRVLSQQDINFLETIVAEVRYQNVPLQKVVLPQSPEEADLYTTDSGYYTKFYMGGDAQSQVGQYLAARNNFKSNPPPSVYLDVRVNGKVFYK
jgi:hypothetical protein